MVNIDIKVDYYAALGLSPDASEIEIKKAYRKLALKYHPDRNPGKESVVLPHFQRIGAANEVLTTPSLKASYDAQRRRFPTTYGTRTDARREARASAAPSWTASAQYAQSFANEFAKTRANASRYNPYTKPSRPAWDSTFEEQRAKASDTFRAFRDMHANAQSGAGAQPRPAPTARQRPAAASSQSSSTHSPRAHSAYEKLFNDPKKDPRRRARMKNGFSPDDPVGDEPMARSNSSYVRSNKSREQFAHMFAATDDDDSSSATKPQPSEAKDTSTKQPSTPRASSSGAKPSQPNGSSTRSENQPSGSNQSQKTPSGTPSKSSQQKHAKPKHQQKSNPSPSTSPSAESGSSDSDPVPINMRPKATPRSRRSRANMGHASAQENHQHDKSQVPLSSDAEPGLFGSWATDGTDSWHNNEQHTDSSRKPTPSGVFGSFFTNPSTRTETRSNENERTGTSGNGDKENIFTTTTPLFNHQNDQKTRYNNTPSPQFNSHGKPSRTPEDTFSESTSFWQDIRIPVSPEGILLDLDDNTESPGPDKATAAPPPPPPPPDFIPNRKSQSANKRSSNSSRPSTHPSASAFTFFTPSQPGVDINFVSSNEPAKFSAASAPFAGTNNQTATDRFKSTAPPNDAQPGSSTFSSSKQQTSSSTPLADQQKAKSPLENFSTNDWAEVLNMNMRSAQPEWTSRTSGGGNRHNNSSSGVRNPKHNGRSKSTNSTKPAETAQTPSQSTQTNTTEGEKMTSSSYVEPEAMDIDEDYKSQSPPQVDINFTQPKNSSTGAKTEKVDTGSTNKGSEAKPFPNLNDLRQTAPFTTTNNGSINNLNDLASSLPFKSKPEAATRQQDPKVHGGTSLQQPPKAPKVPLGLLEHGKIGGGTAFDPSLWKQYITNMTAYFQEWKRFHGAMLTHFNERQKLLESGLSPNWMDAISDEFRVKIDEDTDEEEETVVGGDKKASFGDYMLWLAEDEKIREHWNVAQERHIQVMHEFSKARKAMQKISASSQRN